MRKYASLTISGIFTFSAAFAPLALAEEALNFYNPMQGPVMPVYGPQLPATAGQQLAWQDATLPWLSEAAEKVFAKLTPAVTYGPVYPKATDNSQTYGPYLPDDWRHDLVTGAALAAAQLDENCEIDEKNNTFFTASAVEDETLDASRGTGTVFSAETLGVSIQEAIAVRNSTENTISGNNSLTQNAFNGANGLVSVIQNTGNNVIIQNATVVNLSLQ